MNEQMNILLEILEEIKQQNRELKTSVSNLASQPIPTTTTSEENGISLTDVARLIGQKIEIDGKFKNELTDVAIRPRQTNPRNQRWHHKDPRATSRKHSLSIRENPRNSISSKGQEVLSL